MHHFHGATKSDATKPDATNPDAANPDAKYLALRGEVESKPQLAPIRPTPPTLCLQSLRTRGLNLDERLLLEREGRRYLQTHYQCGGQPTVREWELLVTGWLACIKKRQETHPLTTRALTLLLEDARNPSLDIILGAASKVDVGTLPPIGKRRRLDGKRYTFSRRDSVFGDQALSGHIDGVNGVLSLGALSLAADVHAGNGGHVHVEQLSTNREVIDALRGMEEQNKLLREELSLHKGVVEQLKERIKDMQYDLRALC